MLSTSLIKRATKMAFLMMQLQQDKPGIRQLWTHRQPPQRSDHVLTLLKAGDPEYQAGELPKAL